MNWDPIDFDWNQVRAFLAAAEEGSLSAAARALKQTQPTVSRQVSLLEQRLGVVLFERGHRQLSLTQAGLELIEHVRTMADAAMRLSISASGNAQAIAGRVTVTAGDMVSAYLLPGILAELAERAPQLVVDLAPSNEVRDLMRREADIALRHVAPSEGELIARRLPDSAAILGATRAYLERHGTPSRLQDLRQHRFVGLSPMERYLPNLHAHGVSIGIEQFGCTASNGVTMVALIRRGLGIGVVPEYVANAFPEIVSIVPDHFRIKVPMWIVAHRELHSSQRIRLVFDAIVQGIAAD